MSKKIKAIFWDNDGILVDTEKYYYEASKRVLEEVGMELPEDYFINVSLRLGQSAFLYALERGMSEDEVDLLRERRNVYYTELIASSPTVINGVDKILRQVRTDRMMGIVTSSLKEHFDIVHRNSGILQYFDFIFTWEDCIKRKPDPYPYLKALDHSGFDPDDCIVIEDSERGVHAAYEAGLRCIAIPTHLTVDNDFSEAYLVIPSIEHLPALIDELETE